MSMDWKQEGHTNYDLDLARAKARVDQDPADLLLLAVPRDHIYVVRPLDPHALALGPQYAGCAARLRYGERDEVLHEHNFGRGERSERDAQQERELQTPGW